jgi:hypothetical protein
MFSVGNITKYWLILFKIEVKKIVLFVPVTGKKLKNSTQGLMDARSTLILIMMI